MTDGAVGQPQVVLAAVETTSQVEFVHATSVSLRTEVANQQFSIRSRILLRTAGLNLSRGRRGAPDNLRTQCAHACTVAYGAYRGRRNRVDRRHPSPSSRANRWASRPQTRLWV